MKLTPEENAAVRAALKDPLRFHSDGRAVTMYCATIAILSIPIIVVLLVEGSGSWNLYYKDVPLSEISPLGLLFSAPELVGALALIAVAIGHIVYGVRTFGRHGHVITSFGVARIRGGVKKLIRFNEIATLKLIDRRPPQHKIVTTELEITAKDGRTLSLYGFGVPKQKELIEQELARAR